MSATAASESTVPVNLFIDIEVEDAVINNLEMTQKLVDVCTVDIFRQREDGTLEIVKENLDECVLCYFCVDAAEGGLRIIKLYE